MKELIILKYKINNYNLYPQNSRFTYMPVYGNFSTISLVKKTYKKDLCVFENKKFHKNYITLAIPNVLL